MAKRKDIQTILLVGSGPIVIGQACEFDYSGTQAIKALKEEGYKVILANSNPATIMTDPDLADKIYIEPLTKEFLERIIIEEKPDAILPTMGGQTALNLAVQLAESGILAKHNVKMLGANLESIKKAEDRDLFKKTMDAIGIPSAKSMFVSNIEEGKLALQTTGLPIILRPSFTLGGEGGGIASTEEEYFAILEKGLFLSPTHTVLVEESLIGWKEYELEVIRDKADNVIIICSIENLDPMGVHTGDSITVAPAQTLTDRQYQDLRDQSKKIIRAIGVETGGSNIQFAINPADGRTVVIEMNPRVSRSSALASKATGFPIAKIAAKLAVGYTLDELKNDITSTTPAGFEPTIDYVVTKIPRFDFHKFTSTSMTLGTQMKSVGESMAIGKTFKESFLKALSGMENGRIDLSQTEFDTDSAKTNKELDTILRTTVWTRLFYLVSALRRGYTVSKLKDLTGIDPWFINQIAELVQYETYLKNKSDVFHITKEELHLAKALGFSDLSLSRLLKTSSTEISNLRKKYDIFPTYDLVDTCAAEFDAKTPYLYGTYNTENRRQPEPLEKAVVILGSGPNRIGQGIEFDYCCVHASLAAKELGFKSIMVNYNPETVSTDYDISSRLYFEPITAEKVLDIFRIETKTVGLIAQFGGQTPLKIVNELTQSGVKILGTSPDSIDIAEDRKRFDELIQKLNLKGLKQPPSATVFSKEEAVKVANSMGYPVMLRPSYVLGGRGMKIIYSEEAILRYIDEALEVSDNKPVLIDRFLESAIEVDVDALSDGKTILIGGILEHIEEAGIHSGDSACCIPCFTLAPSIQQRLRDYTKVITKALNVVGLINLQYAVQGEEIYILEVNPRASRTVPFTAKALGIPLAKVATKLMLGKTLQELGYTEDFDRQIQGFNVKMPVFPFHKFPGVDVILGPEMKSTGESMGRDHQFSSSYAKALLGAGVNIPTTGKAVLSVADKDKTSVFVDISRALVNLGFQIEATPGTHAFLQSHDIPCTSVEKVGRGTPSTNLLAKLKANSYSFVVNTSHGEKALADSYSIRRTALEKKIAYCTLLTTARAFVQAIQSLKSGTLSLMPLSKKSTI